MTRLHRLRYVQAFVDRKTGAVFRYFRRPGYPRVRLPGLPGSADFMAAYQAALDAQHYEVGATKRSKPGSLSAADRGLLHVARIPFARRQHASRSPLGAGTVPRTAW